MKPSQDARLRDAIELTLVPGVGSLAQKRLSSAYPAITEIFELGKGALEAQGVSADACLAIKSRRYKEMANEIFDWTMRENCSLLLRGDPLFPTLLDEIYDPPLLLYARGCLQALGSPCIAVVGTRRPSYYGLQIAEGLASDLASRGMVVISGLARGIDGAAHRGCLGGKGRTIAVLGCGIDIVYPREHRQLSQQIAENGLLLTEFPPGTSPAPQNFPVRNRIISGLALGVLIVEASEYSGSLITARLALEHNRELFAVPGNLTSPQSFGPNFLIKQGAKLVQSWRDVVEELPAELRLKMLADEERTATGSAELGLISEDEEKVLDLLGIDRAVQFDMIYQKSGLPIPVLSKLLLELEMKGRIRQVPGNLYVKLARPEPAKK